MINPAVIVTATPCIFMKKSLNKPRNQKIYRRGSPGSTSYISGTA